MSVIRLNKERFRYLEQDLNADADKTDAVNVNHLLSVRQIVQWYRYQTLIQRDVTSERVA